MSKPDALLWLDLETTGGDETLDVILEVGFVITGTSSPWSEEDRGSWVVRPATDRWVRRLKDTPVVAEMHDANGLRAEVEKLVRSDPEGDVDPHDLRIIESAVLAKLDPWGRTTLAGSGVSHFDRRFIRNHMPKLHERLTYAHVDVGVLRRCFDLWGRKELIDGRAKNPGLTPHRALDDVLDHLDEFRHYAAKTSSPSG